MRSVGSGFRRSGVWAAAAFGVLLCLSSALSVSAQSSDGPLGCPVPGSELLGRPNPGAGATEVAVGLYVLDLVHIDDVAQSFTVDLHFSLRWHDSRLRSDVDRGGAPCTLRLTEVWHPATGFLNQRLLERYFEEVVSVDQEGWVLYRQRVYGEFSSPLSLREFPFDSQALPIALASFRYDSEEVDLRLDEERSGRLESFSIAGWSVELGGVDLEPEYVPGQGRAMAKLELSLIAKRNAGFHFWKVLVPLAMIVAMAWAVFWIDPQQLAPQMGVSTASVLTLIAFQFSLGYLLPRVSYLTRADRFVLGASTLVFLALAEAICSSRLAAAGRVELALRIDRHSRWIYPALFVAMALRTLRF